MKKGFTLAEVLITLGIIGVVAALTMPSLLNEIKGRVLESQFKKSYSIINQALVQMIVDEGAPPLIHLIIIILNLWKYSEHTLSNKQTVQCITAAASIQILRQNTDNSLQKLIKIIEKKRA